MDIHLVKIPSTSSSNSKETSHTRHLSYEGEGFGEIKAFDLFVSSNYQPSLVTFYIPVGLVLDFVYPLATDRLATRRKIN